MSEKVRTYLPTLPTLPTQTQGWYHTHFVAKHPALSLLPIHLLLLLSSPILFVEFTILSLSLFSLGTCFNIFPCCGLYLSSLIPTFFSLSQICHRPSTSRPAHDSTTFARLRTIVTDHNKFCETTKSLIVSLPRPRFVSTINIFDLDAFVHPPIVLKISILSPHDFRP